MASLAVASAAPTLAEEDAQPDARRYAPDAAPTEGWTHGTAIGVGVTTLVTGALAIPGGVLTFAYGNAACADADCIKPGLKGLGIGLMAGGIAAVGGGVVMLATAPKAKQSDGSDKQAATRTNVELLARPGGASLKVTF